MTSPTQTVQAPTEVSLLQRIVQRDPAAVSQLYDLQSGYLYAIILRIVGDESDAEDVLQEVFLRVWDRANSYNAELSPPSVWLTRIARNLAIDRLRSKISKARSREENIESHAYIEDGQQNARPDNAAIHSEEQREIAEAMMQLPLEQRTLIEYAYFKGYTQSELAEHFKLPLGTVKTRIRSGMISLRTRLQHLI
ncbi:MAG: sigma-70 family RNA polymerase sigma factor [Bacteroidota bacterium]